MTIMLSSLLPFTNYLSLLFMYKVKEFELEILIHDIIFVPMMLFMWNFNGIMSYKFKEFSNSKNMLKHGSI